MGPLHLLAEFAPLVACAWGARRWRTRRQLASALVASGSAGHGAGTRAARAPRGRPRRAHRPRQPRAVPPPPRAELDAATAERRVAVAPGATARRVELFSASLRHDPIDRLEIETGLRAAREAGELHLLHRPEIDLRSGRFVAVEALLRRNHPTRGPISPATFIPLAEVNGLIAPPGCCTRRAAQAA